MSPAPQVVDPAAGRTFSLDGSDPVTWEELAADNDADIMLEIGLIEVGETVTVGMCDSIRRLS